MNNRDFRYRGLSYVALNVTDLDRSVRFYEDQVGLALVSRDGGQALFRCSDTHHDMILARSERAGLNRVAFAMETEAEFEKARAYFLHKGLAPVDVASNDCEHLAIGAAFRIPEPFTGLTLEFLIGMAPADDPFVPKETRIVRLGHVVIQAKDYDSVVRFMTEQCNFRCSDEVTDEFAFLRAFPNPLHHSFAIRRGPADQLHHVNFMVSDIDDIGRALNRLRRGGAEIVFGPGRHMPSGSIFLYFLDPDEMTVEFSFGMEEFPELQPRNARPLQAIPEVIDMWGGAPHPKYASVGAIERPYGPREQ